jgi:SnoaL-like domain
MIHDPFKHPMNQTPLTNWHELVRTRNAKGIAALLADDVVFHSPVVHTPQVGKALTLQYLSAAFHVFFNDSFRYMRELSTSQDSVLEFQVDIDGIAVNGVDMIKWNAEGEIIEFKVMIRPLKAINLIHQRMAAMLQTEHKHRSG